MNIENNFSEFKNYIENSKNINFSKINLNSFLQEILEKIEKLKQEVLVIDRFEGDYAICENRQSKEFKNIQINKLPANIKEGSVIKYSNGKYEIDIQEEKKIEERIKDKMNKLWE